MKSSSGKSLPFATIKFLNTSQGVIADLNGRFSVVYQEKNNLLEVSYLGFNPKRVELKETQLNIEIVLTPAENSLGEVVIKGNSGKLRRILNTAIANRDQHNPEKYSQYKCAIYYKAVAGIASSRNDIDSAIEAGKKPRNNTGDITDSMRDYLAGRHLLIWESYSRRTWRKPGQLQDEVIATRVSGFQNPLFVSLVTDVLPFHAYDDYINLNGKDYHNPLSKGQFQRFSFKLQDEILQGNDTLWIIAFKPKQVNEELQGSLYIHSNGYAIASLLAQARDTMLLRDISIEQQYVHRADGKWFPGELNYNINWRIGGDTGNMIYLRGNSVIDSVDLQLQEKYHFSKRHTVTLLPGANRQSDTAWKMLRPKQLDSTEIRTYSFMDSLGRANNFDRILGIAGKLGDGKYQIGKLDVDLLRIYSANKYEKSRFGIGLQTNEKISSWFSVGAWAGYGRRDKTWKYGGFVEFYGDQYRDFKARIAYSNDLEDPGRLQINPEIDKNPLRRFLLSRVDKVESWQASVQNLFGYLTVRLNGKIEKINPAYNYNFEYNGKLYNQFNSSEASLDLRYAYGERTFPGLNKYISSGTKYPVLYGKFTMGHLNDLAINYIKTQATLTWQKHINRLGNERLMLTAAKIWGKTTLPISKLYAGNGFALDNISFYVFGGMQTMKPYDTYMDRFINFYWKHQFDFRLYRLALGKKGAASMPSLALAYNVLLGDMQTTTVHKNVDFTVPTNGWHEAGIMANNLLRMKLLQLSYFSLNAGYFLHIHDQLSGRDGKFVLGFGVGL